MVYLGIGSILLLCGEQISSDMPSSMIFLHCHRHKSNKTSPLRLKPPEPWSKINPSSFMLVFPGIYLYDKISQKLKSKVIIMLITNNNKYKQLIIGSVICVSRYTCARLSRKNMCMFLKVIALITIRRACMEIFLFHFFTNFCYGSLPPKSEGYTKYKCIFNLF